MLECGCCHADADASAASTVVVVAVVVARCPPESCVIASLERPTGKYMWPLAPRFRLKMNMAALGFNVAPNIAEEPTFAGATPYNNAHLVEAAYS